MKTAVPVVAMTGGGSGGHITPILSLAHELKALQPSCRIIYIGQAGDDLGSFRVNSHDIDYQTSIKAGKFRRYHGESFISHLLDFKTIALNVRDFFRVLFSIFTSLRILNRTKPDVLFVKGGFVGVPVAIAARLKRIPIITHDSDAVAGLANRIVGRWAEFHATGMPANFYDYPKASSRYLGIPLDSRIKPVSPHEQEGFKRKLGLSGDNFALLVAGGGQGSKAINDKVVKIAPQLLAENPNLHILHITGENNFDDVKAAYAQNLSEVNASRVRAVAHSNQFYEYVAAADLIVSRAGATSIAEYALAGKASIIIPSPFLAAGHQLKNAEVLLAADAAVIVNEEDPPGELHAVVRKLIADQHRRQQLSGNLSQLAKPEAGVELAKLILETASRA